MDQFPVCDDPACAEKIRTLTEQVTALDNENADLNGRVQDLGNQLIGVEA